MKNEINERLLIDVLSQQSESKKTKTFRKWIASTIADRLPGECEFITDNGNLYVTKGTADVYPCVVSHTDTVHDINDNVEVYRAGNNLFAFDTKKVEQYGIGGDDKVGVFICIQLLIDLPYMKCAFFRDEETGCMGSRLAKKDFFSDCAFVLQCDRRGNSDFINEIGGTEMYGKEFKEAIAPILSKHGYKETSGMMTDVQELKRTVDLCMANMSCGYYSPHSSKEIVNITDVMDCYEMVMQICYDMGWKKWEHKGVSRYVNTYNYRSQYSSDWDFYGNEYYRYHEWDSKKRMYVPKKNAPDRYKSAFKSRHTELFHEEEAEAVEIKSGLITSIRPERPSRTDCPMCGNNDSMYDDAQMDYFCSDCMNYHADLVKMKEHLSK